MFELRHPFEIVDTSKIYLHATSAAQVRHTSEIFFCLYMKLSLAALQIQANPQKNVIFLTF